MKTSKTVRIVEFKCEKCGRYDHGLGAKNISCVGYMIVRNNRQVDGHDAKWMRKTGRIFNSWSAISTKEQKETP